MPCHNISYVLSFLSHQGHNPPWRPRLADGENSNAARHVAEPSASASTPRIHRRRKRLRKVRPGYQRQKKALLSLQRLPLEALFASSSLQHTADKAGSKLHTEIKVPSCVLSGPETAAYIAATDVKPPLPPLGLLKPLPLLLPPPPHTVSQQMVIRRRPRHETCAWLRRGRRNWWANAPKRLHSRYRPSSAQRDVREQLVQQARLGDHLLA